MILRLEKHSLEPNSQVISSHYPSSTILVSTDSRSLKNNQWFLPIVGEKFDGHQFIEQLKDKCEGIIFDPTKIEKSKVTKLFENYIEVNDTTLFLQEAANLHVKDWKQSGGLIISITGSNGKTTNKEYLAKTLEKVFPNKVYSTKGNFNNHIGVPFTCLQLNESIKYAVVEMGTNHFGEIELLCRIAEPDIGYITNIGEAHLEYLKDKDGVLREKSALYRFIIENSKYSTRFLLNDNDEYLKKLKKENGVISAIGKIEAKTSMVSIGENLETKVKNPNIFGKINFYNLGLSTLFLTNMFKDKKNEIIEAASNIIPPQNNRSTWISWKNKEVFLDAYNANPSSMMAALDSFYTFTDESKLSPGKLVFILGDMNELGERTIEAHKEISDTLNRYSNSESMKPKVIFVGRYGKHYQAGLKFDSSLFNNVGDLKKSEEELFKDASHVFVKGSRSVLLETLFS